MENKAGLIFLLILAGSLYCESQQLENTLAPRRPPKPRPSPPPRHPPPHHPPPHHPPPHHPPPSHHPPPHHPPPHHPPPHAPPPHHPPPPSPPQYRSFKLALQWPPTSCKDKTCAQNPGRFTIHGLWPQDTTDAGKETLTDAIMNKYKRSLLDNWPDLTTKNFENSKRFWSSEYEKHGVYCTTKFNADQYIGKALELGTKRNIRALLANKGITADETKQYDPATIANAIKNGVGFTPDLQCVKIKNTYYLLEVRLCYNQDATNLINCGGSFGGCANRIYYPPPPEKRTFEEILEIAEDTLDLEEAM